MGRSTFCFPRLCWSDFLAATSNVQETPSRILLRNDRVPLRPRRTDACRDRLSRRAGHPAARAFQRFLLPHPGRPLHAILRSENVDGRAIDLDCLSLRPWLTTTAGTIRGAEPFMSNSLSRGSSASVDEQRSWTVQPTTRAARRSGSPSDSSRSAGSRMTFRPWRWRAWSSNFWRHARGRRPRFLRQTRRVGSAAYTSCCVHISPKIWPSARSPQR